MPLEFLNKNLERKQTERIALDLVEKISSLLDDESYAKNDLINIINSSLGKLSNIDSELAESIVEELQSRYKVLDMKYGFTISNKH